MNLVKLSNLCNIISQMIGAKFYHFGAESDINRSISNNFDPDALLGREYPAVLLEYPTANWSNSPKPRQMRVDVIINFFDLFGRNNAGTADGLNESEKFKTLDDLVSKFFDCLLTLLKTTNIAEGTGIAGDSISLEYLPFQHNDQLVQIAARLPLTFARECTTPDFNDPAIVQAALAALSPSFLIPLTNLDYEKIKPAP